MAFGGRAGDSCRLYQKLETFRGGIRGTFRSRRVALMNEVDYFRIADNQFLALQTTSKGWFLLEIAWIKRDCGYSPIGTLRRTSLKKFSRKSHVVVCLLVFRCAG